MLPTLLGCLIAGSPGADLPPPPPVPPPPALASVFPPGLAVGGQATWTITGSGLPTGGAEVVVDPPAGIRVGPLHSGLDGSGLVAPVAADPGATPGIRTVRVAGPGGLSNPLLVRVDPLPTVALGSPVEAGPPPVVRAGSAGAGTLRALGVDRWRVEGPAGWRVLVDWEARRLGLALDPVLEATGPTGEPLGRALADPLAGGDARLALVIPSPGWFAVALRDNIYRGSSRANYRLRVVLDPPPDPPVAPDDPRWNQAEPIAVGPAGLTLRGTLGVEGEVDRLRIAARAGERWRVRCRSEPPGSRLDPVVTVRDGSGRLVGENDDAPDLPAGWPPPTPDGSPPTASRVEIPPDAVGPWRIEVADRFQGGGPGLGWGYVLAVGPPPDDFALILGPVAPGVTGLGLNPGGAVNLAPGSPVDLPLLIVPEGFPGTVEVRAVGLPPGVTAEPITVRTAPRRRATRATTPALGDAPPVADALRLRVAAGAPSVRGSIRVVAHRLIQDGEPGPDRLGTLAVPLDPGTGAPRPVWHWLSELPVQVIAPAR